MTSQPRRRPAIDVARVLALMIVVGGHLVMAVVDRPDGEIRGVNIFELEPGWAWLAALAPMPVFFAAGGWANATADVRTAAPRLAALVGTATVVVAVWSVALGVAVLSTGSEGLIGQGARLATQPLWFLAAYVPLAASGRRLAEVVRRHPRASLAVVGGGLVVVDVLYHGFDAPELVGWIGFPLAWATPWLLGAGWRIRVERGGFSARRAGIALVVVGVGAGWALVAFAGYVAPLIDVSDDARSNTNPPGLYTAVIGTAQVGALLIAAPALDRIGLRWRTLWARLGEAAVGVYVWHLTALSLAIGLLELGAWAPRRLTVGWWASRPVWWTLVLAITAALTVATGAVRRRGPERGGGPVGLVRGRAGVVVSTGGAALVGLVGPRSIGFAVACTLLLTAGWWLLRGPGPTGSRRRAGPRRHGASGPRPP